MEACDKQKIRENMTKKGVYLGSFIYSKATKESEKKECKSSPNAPPNILHKYIWVDNCLSRRQWVDLESC